MDRRIYWINRFEPTWDFLFDVAQPPSGLYSPIRIRTEAGRTGEGLIGLCVAESTGLRLLSHRDLSNSPLAENP
jgi:hypothetical protein